MNSISAKAFFGLLFVYTAMAAALFMSAGTLDYWQGWTLLTLHLVLGVLITTYLMKKDTGLLKRRLAGGPTAEKETTQKIIQSITATGFMAMLVVPGLDQRFHWLFMPAWISIAGYVLDAIGFLIIFFVYKQNTYASAIIEIAPGQHVISTGLYGLVRHPMYMGGMFIFIGMPLGLGSLYGLVPVIAIVPALIWRMFDEEKFLAKNLEGYAEYQTKVRHRLVPLIW